MPTTKPTKKKTAKQSKCDQQSQALDCLTHRINITDTCLERQKDVIIDLGERMYALEQDVWTPIRTLIWINSALIVACVINTIAIFKH